MTRAREDQLFAEYRTSGSPRALGELYDLVAPELLHVALHLAGDPAAAEDLLQATLVTAIERAPSYDATRPVRPWLLGILARKAKQLRAREGRRPDAERLVREEPARPEDEAARTELLERLNAELARLPVEWRPVLTLRLRHGLSATEIAHALERPPGTVRSQLARGLESLRRALPAGLAGALAAVTTRPARGLSAVREAMLAEAAALQPAALGAGTILGALLMKKGLLAAGTLAALSLTLALIGGETPRSDALGAEDEGAQSLQLEGAGELALGEQGEREELATREPARDVARAVAARDERPATGELHARVVWDDSGRPVPGEVVIVRSYAAGRVWPAESVARTDAQGRARFAGLEPGTTRVAALRGAERSAYVRAGGTTGVELRLSRGVEVAGRVVDERGEALPEVGIWLSDGRRTNRGHLVLRTDAGGHFSLPGVPPGQYVGARAKGFAPTGLRPVRGAPGGRQEIELVLVARAGTLTGRVTDGAGRPVARAEVLAGDETVAFDQRIETGLYVPGSPPSLAVCDASGAFRLESVPLGLQPVQVRAPGFAPWRGEVAITARATEAVDLVLVPAAGVLGRVRDAAGQPVSRARIAVVAQGDFGRTQTYSAPDGSFELGDLPVGAVTLIATHAEAGQAVAELLLAAAERREWDAVLVATPRVHGVVRDELGRPLARWPISLFDPELPPPNWHGTVTDAEGRFTISGVEDAPHRMTVSAAGALGHFPRLVLEGVRPSPVPLELTVDTSGRESGAIIGQVLGPGGVPAEGVEVSIWHEELNALRGFSTDARTGKFEVAPLPPGRLTVRVQSEHHPWSRLEPFELVGGEVVDLGTIELPAAARIHGAIEGVADGHLESLSLVLTDERGAEAGVVSRTGREYRTSPLRAGRYVLRAQGNLVAPQRLELELRAGVDERRDLRFEPAGMRVVRIVPTPASSEPVYPWCAALDAHGRQQWVGGNLPFVDGAYEARVSLPPGTYRLLVGSRPGARAQGELTVAGPGVEQAPLELPLVLGEPR